ncbi:hypothetical protein MMC22_004304 [Lobaria immixta]|nr:hypothetical protein [Lobaria immixta]
MIDLKLLQYGEPSGEESSERQVISRVLITFETLNKLARKERVSIWNLPLSALQRKIGENGRFCLAADGTVIDNVFEFTLFRYRGKSPVVAPSLHGDRGVLKVYWIELNEAPQKSLVTAEVPQNANDSRIMKENGWEYVFQARSILNCSLVDSGKTSFKKAPFAAFQIRDPKEDHAELPLPRGDEKAKIPAWSLSTRPSRTYMIETDYELEKSAINSSNSKKSIDVGLSGSYKEIIGEAKYGRTKESSYKDSRSYGRKERNMFLIHEVPVVDISLHEGNSRLSESCRQALLKLRDLRRFSDLMDFFSNYGNIYAKRITLGGRLLASQEDYQQTTSNTVVREQTFKQSAAVSLGIIASSIKGGYSSEQGYASSSSLMRRENQAVIDWRAYGGNVVHASKPDQWRESLNDFHYWQVIENTEIESIQDFIGSLPGYDDIPGLFDSILRSGLYDPYALWLCQGTRPMLPPGPESSKAHRLGTGVNSLSGDFQDTSPFMEFSPPSIATATRTVKGGVSWQVLESNTSVQEEISSFLQMVKNTGTNHRCVPSYFYEMTLLPKTVTVILQWSTDTMSFGLNNDVGTGRMAVQHNSLSELYPIHCKDLGDALNALNAFPINSYGHVDSYWERQTGAVNKALESLQNVMDSHRGTPLYDWLRKRQGVWIATWRDLAGFVKREEWSRIPVHTRTLIQENAVAMMKNQIQTLISGDPGSDGITFENYSLTSVAKKSLDSDFPDKGAEAFIREYGHTFVESYTEKGTLSAIWSLKLDQLTSDENEMETRLLIQKYFRGAPSVSEACEFLEGGIRSHINLGLQLNIKTSIFGFCDPASTTPRVLHAIEPWHAKYYLTPDALQRNRVRTSYRLRPFEKLQVNFADSEERQKEAFLSIKSVVPDQLVVLSLQDILRQLFVLNAYAEVPVAKVVRGVLEDHWKKFNQLEAWDATMDSRGKILDKGAEALNVLSGTLQKELQAAEANMLGRSVPA